MKTSWQTLREFAQEHKLSYRTAWNYFKAGKIPFARKKEFGKILIEEGLAKQKTDYVVCYATVSSSENKSSLDKQAERLVDYCMAKDYQVKVVVKECASGLNDKRPKLLKLLLQEEVSDYC
jgi:predicted site-specific integrase-resolvase